MVSSLHVYQLQRVVSKPRSPGNEKRVRQENVGLFGREPLATRLVFERARLLRTHCTQFGERATQEERREETEENVFRLFLIGPFLLSSVLIGPFDSTNVIWLVSNFLLFWCDWLVSSNVSIGYIFLLIVVIIVPFLFMIFDWLVYGFLHFDWSVILYYWMLQLVIDSILVVECFLIGRNSALTKCLVIGQIHFRWNWLSLESKLEKYFFVNLIQVDQYYQHFFNKNHKVHMLYRLRLSDSFKKNVCFLCTYAFPQV